MGQSTDAILWFGACWTENDEKYYESGLPMPVQAFMRSQHGLENNEDDDDDGSTEFHDKMVSLVEKLIAPFGCKLVSHCHGDSTMYGLAIKESVKTVSRGYPERVALDVLYESSLYKPLESNDYGTRVHHACAAVGWPLELASWWLASYWC